MLILIVKDSATKVPREVTSVAEAEAYEAQGFTVEWPDGKPADEPAAEPELPAKKVAKKTAEKG